MSRKVKENVTSLDNKKNISKKKDVIVTEKVNFSKPRFKLYFGFKARAFCYFFFFVILFSFSLYLLNSSLSYQRQEYISYSERSNLDYKVNLKSNNYYESNVLNKDMIYVASLIDYIDIYFNYNFDIDDNVNMNFTYNVIGKLSITDDEGENIFLEKEYTLLDNKQINIENSKHASISENVKIDYGLYNSIASGFKSTYGVNAKSNFIVTLKIIKNSNNDNFKVNNSVSNQIVNIPLSEKAINIKLDYVDINTNSSVVNDSSITVSNVLFIGLGIFLLVFSIYFVLKFIKLLESNRVKLNNFDKYVKKILRTYDRLIVESRTIIDFNNYEVIKVNNFEELLDVRDNLKLPINYYVIVPHQKAYFYIISTNIYLYIVKDIDLEKNR